MNSIEQTEKFKQGHLGCTARTLSWPSTAKTSEFSVLQLTRHSPFCACVPSKPVRDRPMGVGGRRSSRLIQWAIRCFLVNQWGFEWAVGWNRSHLLCLSELEGESRVWRVWRVRALLQHQYILVRLFGSQEAFWSLKGKKRGWRPSFQVPG